MKIPIEQVWEYELKPDDTMRVLLAFKEAWRLKGCEIALERRGDRLYVVRREKDKPKYKCPEIEAFGKAIFEGFPSIRRNDD